MTNTFLYTDDYMKAAENLRMTIPFLSEHKIPASPLNYQVAYEFVSGNNASLKKTLDELLEQRTELSETTLLALYKQHVALDDKTLESVRQELNKIISTIRSGYDSSNVDLTDYMNSLNVFTEVLAGASDLSELATEVNRVIEDTLSTEQSQRKYESQMSSMMEEMETLRKQLKQVREESLTDALTGLANRKAFDQMLAQLIQQSADQDMPFCLVIGDIDHFKKFNDTFGHLVGDKVLRYVGKTIISCVKGKDMAARFGGEEFVLILPDTRLAGAEIVAEQVREAISKKNLSDHSKNDQYGRITLSLGIGQFKRGEQSDDLLNRVDQALYQAKENGRNRVEKAL